MAESDPNLIDVNIYEFNGNSSKRKREKSLNETFALSLRCTQTEKEMKQRLTLMEMPETLTSFIFGNYLNSNHVQCTVKRVFLKAIKAISRTIKFAKKAGKLMVVLSLFASTAQVAHGQSVAVGCLGIQHSCETDWIEVDFTEEGIQQCNDQCIDHIYFGLTCPFSSSFEPPNGNVMCMCIDVVPDAGAPCYEEMSVCDGTPAIGFPNIWGTCNSAEQSTYQELQDQLGKFKDKYVLGGKSGWGINEVEVIPPTQLPSADALTFSPVQEASAQKPLSQEPAATPPAQQSSAQKSPAQESPAQESPAEESQTQEPPAESPAQQSIYEKLSKLPWWALCLMVAVTVCSSALVSALCWKLLTLLILAINQLWPAQNQEPGPACLCVHCCNIEPQCRCQAFCVQSIGGCSQSAEIEVESSRPHECSRHCDPLEMERVDQDVSTTDVERESWNKCVRQWSEHRRGCDAVQSQSGIRNTLNC